MAQKILLQLLQTSKCKERLSSMNRKQNNSNNKYKIYKILNNKHKHKSMTLNHRIQRMKFKNYWKFKES